MNISLDCNNKPLTICSPKGPEDMDWASYYPAYVIEDKQETEAQEEAHDQKQASSVKTISKPVEIADIGCGFGGLLFALAPKLPETLILGTTNFVLGEVPLLTSPRHGNPYFSNRIRARKGARLAGSEYFVERLPKCVMHPCQHDEVPPKLLCSFSAFEDLPLLPGPALQAT
jgi:hypothetical protein